MLLYYLRYFITLYKATATIKKLYEVFMKYDGTLLEINPMAEDSTGKGTSALMNNKNNFPLEYVGAYLANELDTLQ